MPKQSYTYSHPRPILAADSVVFTVRDEALHVLLVRRGHDPFEGRWALPGGFVNENEPLEQAGARELREETGLDSIPLSQLRAYGDPGRDPRGWTVSIVFLALIDYREHEVRAGDDAREVQWFPVASLPPLAFDHDHIVEYAVNRLSAELKSRGEQPNCTLPALSEMERRRVLEAVADLVRE